MDTPRGLPKIVGRYALYEEIASGGMAAVHYGRMQGPQGFSRTVAIKRLHGHLAKDPEFAAMFLDEARLAARIRHPNVVQTLDVVTLDKELLVVMDYVQGESLGRLVRASKIAKQPIPLPIVSAILCGALYGLHAAHEATNEQGEPLRLVHRDVSPQNVLVGADGVARVLDFGVAKARGRQHTTRDGQLKGKIAYMAPEQVSSENVDRRTDVYAAGIVLWEALTLGRLFTGDNEAAVMAAALDKPVQPPSNFAPHVPAELDAICLRALERDPTRRFQDAHELANALEKCAPPATPMRVAEWVASLASDVLSKRAAAVARIESASGSTRLPVEAPEPEAAHSQVSGISVPSAPAKTASRRSVAALFALAAIAVGAIVAFTWQRNTSGAAPPQASPPLPSQASASATALVASTAPPIVVEAPRSASAAPIVHAPPRHGVAASSPTPSAAKPSCDPPYTVDSAGHHQYKPECL
jgi:eukaryotic-like serine/threonine-protein kinase